MKKILLLLIASSSISLMGMDERNLLQAPPPYSAGPSTDFRYVPDGTSVPVGEDRYAPQATGGSSAMDNETLSALRAHAAQDLALARLLQRAQPWCQTDYDKERDDCFLQSLSICLAAPIFCALGCITDIVLTPCVWMNRRDNPEGMQGRHHYCFVTRRLCRQTTGVSAINIQGNRQESALFGQSCKIDCEVPPWDSEDRYN